MTFDKTSGIRTGLIQACDRVLWCLIGGKYLVMQDQKRGGRDAERGEILYCCICFAAGVLIF